jgi:hypothetical protein
VLTPTVHRNMKSLALALCGVRARPLHSACPPTAAARPWIPKHTNTERQPAS